MKNGDDCVRFKDSYHSNGAVIMDNHPLMIMAREEQRNLLRHPLCLSLGINSVYFLTFPVGFLNPNHFSNLNYNCSNALDLRNLQEQVKKAFCFKNCTDLSLFE